MKQPNVIPSGTSCGYENPSPIGPCQKRSNGAFRLLFCSILATLCSGLAWTGFAATYATTPISDAFVATGPTGNLSNNNYGGGGALAIAASGLTNGEFQSVIKFSLSGALSSFNAQFGAGQWSVQSISLQLVSSAHNNAIYNDIVPGLFGVSLMQNNSWVEGNSLQSFINNATDQALGTFSFPGGASGSNSYSLSLSSDLSADLLAGSDVTLRFFAADDQVSYLFNSRNVATAGQPQLIIAVVPEPGSLALFSAAMGLFARTFLRRSCQPAIQFEVPG
jgi:hypothetical protein